MVDQDARFKENPFCKDMVIDRTSKQVQVSSLGKDDNVLVNQSTGEISGTHVITYKQVDGAQFVKLFTANIALTFDLKAAGIKAFSVLLWALQDLPGQDLIPLDTFCLESFNDSHEKKMSAPTFNRGLSELVRAQIIAKSTRRGSYFINPNFVFNGNRIAFTNAYERK